MELEKNTGPALVELAKNIHRWISPLVDEVTWGQARGRMVPTVIKTELGISFLFFVPTDNLEVRFVYLRKQPPFDAESVIHELLRKMNEVPGLSLRQEALGRKPGFPLQLLAAPGALEKSQAAIEWMIDQIRPQH